MKNPTSSQHRSISRRLTLGLIVTLLAVTGLSLGVNFIFSSRQATADLEQKADEYIQSLTDTLRLPLWTYNVEMIKAIGQSYSQNEFVIRLLIEGEDGVEFFKKDQTDERLVISRAKDIVYGNDVLGRVEIGLSSGYYFALGRQLFLSSSLTILLMIAALLVVTGILLRQFLNKPMSGFIEMVQAYAGGNSDAFKEESPYKEFSPLVGVLNEMGQKLEAQMRSLQLTQHAVDHSSVAIYWIDRDANITYANDAAVQDSGYAKEELGRMSLTEIEHDLTDPIWQKRLEELKIEGSLTFEAIHLRKNHSQFPAHVTATFFEFGQHEYIFAFVSDITRRKKAEEKSRELAELEKFSKLAVGREKIMIGLKEEINALLQRLNQPEKYKIVT